MSKTRRNYNEERYEDEEYGMDIDVYRKHKQERRISRSLKSLDLEDLLNMEDDD
jgi:hypothetical protein